MAVSLAHLLKWEYQPDRRGSNWGRTIEVQRERIELWPKKTASLAPMLPDPDWIMDMWAAMRARRPAGTPRSTLSSSPMPVPRRWNKHGRKIFLARQATAHRED
jgi:hypothetical protein